MPNYVDKGFLEDRGSVIKNTVAKKYVQHDFFCVWVKIGFSNLVYWNTGVKSNYSDSFEKSKRSHLLIHLYGKVQQVFSFDTDQVV